MQELSGIWIPKEILDIKEIDLTCRIVFSCIYFLGFKKPCNVSNEYLAEIIGIGVRTVADAIERLEKKSFITRDTKGRNRIIYLNAETALRNNLECSKFHFECRNCTHPSADNVILNAETAQYNIDNKIIINNNKGIKSLKEFFERSGANEILKDINKKVE